MADVTIGGIATAATVVADADLIEIEQGGTTKKATLSLLKPYLGNTLTNQSTAAQSPSAATLTYLTGSNLSIPSGLLRVGTRFQWRAVVTKTAAGTATRTFHVRLGTAGTTADPVLFTLTTGAGTAAIDTAWIEIGVTIRGPLSASCIASGSFLLQHELASTGFLAKASNVISSTSGTFNATTANLIIGLSVTSGASELLTFQQVDVSALNL